VISNININFDRHAAPKTAGQAVHQAMDAPLHLGQGDSRRIEEGIPMKLKVLAVVALLLAPSTAASAQQTRTAADAAKRVYNWCMRAPSGSIAECSCVAGFYAGVTEPDEFQVVAAVVDFISADGEVADMNGMVAAMQAAKVDLNLTDARYNELIERFTKFEETGSKGDSVCGPLKDHVKSLTE
jgi:hypothetical protein